MLVGLFFYPPPPPHPSRPTLLVLKHIEHQDEQVSVLLLPQYDSIIIPVLLAKGEMMEHYYYFSLMMMMMKTPSIGISTSRAAGSINSSVASRLFNGSYSYAHAAVFNRFSNLVTSKNSNVASFSTSAGASSPKYRSKSILILNRYQVVKLFQPLIFCRVSHDATCRHLP